MSSLQYNKATDEFQLVELEPATLKPPRELTALDYITFVLGARDYNYIFNENKLRLDNEVTSLYPICSFEMLHFIIYLLTKLDPVANHIFDFKKDKKYGVYSQVFHDTVQSVYKKFPLPSVEFIIEGGVKRRRKNIEFIYNDEDKGHLAYNLNNREFSYLRLHSKPRLLQNYFPHTPTYLNKLANLAQKQDTLYIKYSNKEVKKIKELGHFKMEILLYLPRFYFNSYSRLWEITSKISTIGNILKMKNSDNPYEFNTSKNLLFTKLDKQKMYLSTGIDYELGETFRSNLKEYFDKIGAQVEIAPGDLTDIFVGKRREEPITDIYELNEFMIKSILVRRAPNDPINTPVNNTNGVYLLNKGIGRLRLWVTDEIYEGARDDYLYTSTRFLKVKNKKLGVPAIIDYDSPYLLNKKIIELIDMIYDKHPVHRVIKYADIYTRLFNQFGNNVIWFLLGAHLDTDFDLEQCLQNKELLKSRNGKKGHRLPDTLFEKFEELITYHEKHLVVLLTRMIKHNYYSKSRKEYMLDKFKILPDSRQIHP